MLRIVTVGVYGFTLGTFLTALDEARVDCVFDVRQRRGVRGAAYAWANAQRLQLELAHMGRVSVLAELSGSMAHELNQPIFIFDVLFFQCRIFFPCRLKFFGGFDLIEFGFTDFKLLLSAGQIHLDSGGAIPSLPRCTTR